MKKKWKCKNRECRDSIGEIRPGDKRLLLPGGQVVPGNLTVTCHCGQKNTYVLPGYNEPGHSEPEPEPPSPVTSRSMKDVVGAQAPAAVAPPVGHRTEW